MSFQASRRIQGQIAVGALAVLILLVVVGCVIFAREASAQAVHKSRPVRFAPVGFAILNPLDGPVSIGVNSVDLNLMLPAVQDASTPFSFEAVFPDGSTETVAVPLGGRMTAQYKLKVTYNPNNGTFHIHISGPGIVNERIRQFASNTDGASRIGFRVFPAIRHNGDEAPPEAAGLVLHCIGDGDFGGDTRYQASVTPVP